MSIYLLILIIKFDVLAWLVVGSDWSPVYHDNERVWRVFYVAYLLSGRLFSTVAILVPTWPFRLLGLWWFCSIPKHRLRDANVSFDY